MKIRNGTKTLLLSLGLTLVFSLFSLTPVFADCGGAPTNIINCKDGATGEEAIYDVLGWAVRIFTVAVGVLAIIGVVIVGIQYLTAKDNEEQVRKAKKRLVNIIIGIIAYVLLATAANFFTPGGFFNDFYKQYVENNSGDNGENPPSNDNPGDTSSPSEPGVPEHGDPPTGDEGWIDRREGL